MIKEDQEGIKAQDWGFPRHPKVLFKESQASKKGMPKASPSSSTIIRSSPLKLCFYCFTYYVLFLEHIFVLLSVLLFVCFCFLLLSGYVVTHLFVRETRSVYL